MRKVIAHVPVLHKGYLSFLEQGGGGELLIPDKEILSLEEYLWRDMRALDPHEMAIAIRAFQIFAAVKVVGKSDLVSILPEVEIVMPEEDISFKIAELLPKGVKVSFVPVFLRWNNFNVLNQGVKFWDREQDEDDFLSSVIAVAKAETGKSTDWWRQVGAAVFRDGKIIFAAHNRHLPTPLEPFYSGDPRTVFQQGQFIEYSSAIHAEAAIVAQAARTGTNLSGADMFVTTYPCPPCANLISQTGIRTLYVADGYSRLDAKEIFAKAKIEVVKINKPSSL